ncbi:unnamed protein product [Thelazia callipaeda]|uniref:Secreted protein n=1 Tax=Thelazia callipaeda TaxID=103827 RepID=A0A0N5CSY6_THECL|nr:unnamed protein product [Thelazia callipaeda]
MFYFWRSFFFSSGAGSYSGSLALLVPRSDLLCSSFSLRPRGIEGDAFEHFLEHYRLSVCLNVTRYIDLLRVASVEDKRKKTETGIIDRSKWKTSEVVEESSVRVMGKHLTSVPEPAELSVG